MIVCNLTKPESTLDQVRKHYPKLQHTDAAQLAVALILSGKYALAHYDERAFKYPEELGALAQALSKEIALIQTSVENTKKAKAAAAEEEPVEVKIALSSNIEEGETVLGNREDLKTLLSDALQEGVEFQFGPTDVLWQWALDRTNWNTVSGGELTRRVKLKTEFRDNSVGTDLAATGGKKRGSRAKVAAVVEVPVEDVAAPAELVTDEEVPS